MDEVTKKYSALDITDRIFNLAKNNDGLVTDLTNLKLQKILFYAQGWFAANKDQRLFEDDIEAWPLGPVVVKVYERFKSDGAANLVELVADEEIKVDEDKVVDTFLEQLLGIYGKMSAYELVARTHEEEVWKKNSVSLNKLMPFDDIKKAFKLKLVES
jgi:uncharacterized phage-associated protein